MCFFPYNELKIVNGIFCLRSLYFVTDKGQLLNLWCFGIFFALAFGKHSFIANLTCFLKLRVILSIQSSRISTN